jgi:hypothetical protein
MIKGLREVVNVDDAAGDSPACPVSPHAISWHRGAGEPNEKLRHSSKLGPGKMTRGVTELLEDYNGRNIHNFWMGADLRRGAEESRVEQEQSRSEQTQTEKSKHQQSSKI